MREQYVIKSWNGQMGAEAQVILEDASGQQALCSPSRPSDVVFVRKSLVDEMQNWIPQGDEPVYNINDLAFDFADSE